MAWGLRPCQKFRRSLSGSNHQNDHRSDMSLLDFFANHLARVFFKGRLLRKVSPFGVHARHLIYCTMLQLDKYMKIRIYDFYIYIILEDTISQCIRSKHFYFKQDSKEPQFERHPRSIL